MAGRDRSAILTFTFAAGHLGAFTPYAFLANDLVAQAALYTHHQYIGGFFMCSPEKQLALLPVFAEWLWMLRAFYLGWC